MLVVGGTACVRVAAQHHDECGLGVAACVKLAGLVVVGGTAAVLLAVRFCDAGGTAP
jgi:hypothetical protein